MVSLYPQDETPVRRARPLRTAAIVAGLAFLVGAILMGWAMSRWAPMRQMIAAQEPPGNVTSAVPQVVAALPPPAAPIPAPGVAMADNAMAPSTPPPAAGSEVDGRVSELEARIARVDLRAAAAAGNAGRAEGLLLAFAARRAIDRGTGLGYIEAQLRDRFGTAQPRAVAVVIAGAQAPVTLASLRQGLDALAPQLAGRTSNEDWWTATQRTLGSLIVVRREGSGSPAPDERLARARLMLDGGAVDTALVEVARLPGAEAANGWMTQARRYVEAHQALDILEASALMPPPPGSVPAAPAN